MTRLTGSIQKQQRANLHMKSFWGPRIPYESMQNPPSKKQIGADIAPNPMYNRPTMARARATSCRAHVATRYTADNPSVHEAARFTPAGHLCLDQKLQYTINHTSGPVETKLTWFGQQQHFAASGVCPNKCTTGVVLDLRGGTSTAGRDAMWVLDDRS